MLARMPALLKRLIVPVGVLLMAAYAFFVRCEHLFNPDHYFIISPDSHFFHWQAERVMAGESIPMRLHSGLTYPLVYLAKAFAWIFGLESAEALRLASMLLSPVLGVIGLLILYFAVAKMYDRRTALLSAFVWSIMWVAYFFQSGGYLDRDPLTMLLIMLGAYAFHFSAEWRFDVYGHNLGWVVGASLVLAVQVLLFIEWLWLGPVVLLIVLFGAFAAQVLAAIWSDRASRILRIDNLLVVAREALSGIPGGIRQSNWRPLLLILAVSLIGVTVNPGLPAILRTGAEVAGGGEQASELAGLSLSQLLGFNLLIVPIVAGIYVGLKHRRTSDCLHLGWFVILFAAGMISTRLFFYVAPAAAAIGGLGLSFVLSFNVRRQWLRYAKRVAVGLLLFLLVLGSLSSPYRVGSVAPVAANNDWEDALTWLEDNTPEESVIMSWWDYGYWILDMAHRKPVVNNGIHPDEADLDIARVYLSTDDSEAVGIMRKYGAKYLILSSVEYRILPSLTHRILEKSYGDGHSIPSEIADSLYSRSLSPDFSSMFLKRVYTDPTVDKIDVVVLQLV